MSEYLIDVELPSGAKCYAKEDKIPEKIQMRAITVADEKKMFGSSSDVIGSIIQSCVVEPAGFKVSKLLSPDKMFLILKLRSHTYGSEYTVEYKCPNCGAIKTETVNLDELEVIKLSDSQKFPFEITLPKSDDVLEIKMLTGEDDESINRKVKRHLKKYKQAKEVETRYIFRMMEIINSVNGDEMNVADLRDYVEKLHSVDSNYIWHMYNGVEFGIDTEILTECDNCGEDLEFELPINSTFFRPEFND